LNILIFTIPFAADTKSSATGPISSILGPLVPFIWIILFGFMGAASYFFEKSNNFINKKVNLIQFLIVLCALYPIYTLGFRSELIGLYGNLTTLISSIFLIKHLWIKSLISALLIMPTTIWLILASIWLSYEVLGLSF
jgi:tryptophan-rich sensory protein